MIIMLVIDWFLVGCFMYIVEIRVKGFEKCLISESIMWFLYVNKKKIIIFIFLNNFDIWIKLIMKFLNIGI